MNELPHTDEHWLAMVALDQYPIDDGLPKSTSVVYRIHQLGHAWEAALIALADTAALKRTPSDRCEGRYPVPQTSPPRDEPFKVTYRCGLLSGHAGPHGSGA